MRGPPLRDHNNAAREAVMMIAAAAVARMRTSGGPARARVGVGVEAVTAAALRCWLHEQLALVALGRCDRVGCV